MNINDLKKLITEVVRMEIETTLPIVLNEYFSKNKELLSEDLKNDSVNNKKTKDLYEQIEENMGVDLSKIKEPQRKIIKTYTKDPVLNSILNETVCKIPQEGSMIASSILPSGKQSVQIANNIEESQQSKSVLPMKNYGEILKKSKQKSGNSLNNNVGFSIDG